MLGFSIFKVNGESMSPFIPNQSYVLTQRWLTKFFIGEGKKLLIAHKSYGLIVKKVALVDHHGFIWLKGENNKSVSVEQIGPVDQEQVIGIVIAVFTKHKR